MKIDKGIVALLRSTWNITMEGSTDLDGIIVSTGGTIYMPFTYEYVSNYNTMGYSYEGSDGNLYIDDGSTILTNRPE